MITGLEEAALKIREDILFAAKSTVDLNLSVKRNKAPREHGLGISGIGTKCDRCLWLKFNKVPRDGVSGRQQLLFEFGDYIEESLLHYMSISGYRVEGRQHESSICDGLVKGHCDGVISGNLPGPIGKKWVVIDTKSANNSNFKAVSSIGTFEHQPSYYLQVNTYAVCMGVHFSGIVYQNKNDSEIFVELFRTDTNAVQVATERVERIISMDNAPACNGEYMDKKYCDYKANMYR